MTTECFYCGNDNAYCDGVEYVCPDCGHTWPCRDLPREDKWDDDDDKREPNVKVRISRNGRRVR